MSSLCILKLLAGRMTAGTETLTSLLHTSVHNECDYRYEIKEETGGMTSELLDIEFASVQSALFRTMVVPNNLSSGGDWDR